jgi:PAS domain S-box-containing protein
MFTTADQLWNRLSRTVVLLTSAGMIVAIAILDWWTTPYVSLGLLYLFPIMLAAGFLARPALIAACIACAGLSEAFSSLDPAGRFFRLIFEFLAFVGCGLFVAELCRKRSLSLETQARLHALVETSPAAIVTLDEHGLVELANRAAIQLMVPNRADLIGQPIAAFLPELQNALRNGDGPQFRAWMQCQGNRDNGEIFEAEVWFSTYRENGTPKLAAIVADVTDQRPDAGISDPPCAGGAERPNLNSRQVAVLRLVFEGFPNGEIGTRLEMTPSAVKNTMQQLFLKTGVNNRGQLVRIALEQFRDLL